MAATTIFGILTQAYVNYANQQSQKMIVYFVKSMIMLMIKQLGHQAVILVVVLERKSVENTVLCTISMNQCGNVLPVHKVLVLMSVHNVVDINIFKVKQNA